MSDLYSELLVKKKERTMKDKLMKGGMIALVVIFGLAGILFMPLLLFWPSILGIVAYFVFSPAQTWNLSTCLSTESLTLTRSWPSPNEKK